MTCRHVHQRVETGKHDEADRLVCVDCNAVLMRRCHACTRWFAELSSHVTRAENCRLGIPTAPKRKGRPPSMGSTRPPRRYRTSVDNGATEHAELLREKQRIDALFDETPGKGRPS